MTTEKKLDLAKRKHVKSKEKEPEKFNKRVRRQMKLKARKHSEIIVQLLPLSEILRREDTPTEKRHEIIDKIFKLSKDAFYDLCLSRDTAHIIESVIQYSSELQRWQMYTSLFPHILALSKSRFGKFVITKLINYGLKEHRMGILKVYTNRIARLVRHKCAVELIDLLYNDYANAAQRGAMMQELYGNKHALQLVENKTYTLADALKLNPDKNQLILNNLAKYLVLLVGKGLNKYTIVQRLLLEYLQIVYEQTLTSTPTPEANPPPVTNTSAIPIVLIDEQEVADDLVPKSLDDNIASLLESFLDGELVNMLHTRDGVRIALYLLWLCGPSKRKMMIKSLKTCVTNIAINEHGCLFLMGLLDFVDDVVLLEKVVIKELLDDIELIVSHPNSRKVLLYALSPRDRHHFSPQFLQSLIVLGDSNKHTKKSLGYRALEMRSVRFGLLPILLDLAIDRFDDIYVGNAISDSGRIMILQEVLIRSASYHLDSATVMSTYNRSNSTSSDIETPKQTCPITESDVGVLQIKREKALKSFITHCLIDEFVPSQGQIQTDRIGKTKSRDDLRMSRRKRAIHDVENSLMSNKKVEAFTSNEDSPMDVPVVVSDHMLPILERSEICLLLRRLLQEEKTHKDYSFANMLMELVPSETIQSWTKCNRGCFVLVGLYELGDQSICDQVRQAINPDIVNNQLANSTFSGAKILYKHLINL